MARRGVRIRLDVEDYYTLLDLQHELLEMLPTSEVDPDWVPFDAATWDEFRNKLPDAHKGFLSDRARDLMNIISRGRLWGDIKRMYRLRELLERDFDRVRQIYVQQGRVYVAQERPVLSVDQPIDFLKAVGASTRPGRRGPEARGSRGRARGERHGEEEVQEGEGQEEG